MRSEAFTIVRRARGAATEDRLGARLRQDRQRSMLPDGVTQAVPGSSWGTFTIACTIPIALFVGLYMYCSARGGWSRRRSSARSRMLAATVAGNWIPGSPLEHCFSFRASRRFWRSASTGSSPRCCRCGCCLCPRDYLSSFLKIGTIALLVVAVIVANPKLEAPDDQPAFRRRRRARLRRRDLSVLLHLHHVRRDLRLPRAGVVSGTTPKMIAKESHIRTIGYGAMLIEGLVGIVALIAAASLPQGDYWAINIDLSRARQVRRQARADGRRPPTTWPSSSSRSAANRCAAAPAAR